MLKNEVGNIYSRLTVLSRYDNTSNGTARWLCQCSCGNKTIQTGCILRRGIIKSCGCYLRESKTKHLSCFTKEYKSWQAMKDRCNNSKSKDFYRYGERGITVCEKWENDFSAFFADMGERPKGYSLGRIDNNAGYFPENCRWESPLQQSNNTRKTRLITHNGKTLSISAWARELNVSAPTISNRLKKYGQIVKP